MRVVYYVTFDDNFLNDGQLRYAMEGMSFLDFLLAEALVGGLRRDLRPRDGATPKNFFVLPKDDVRAWQKIHESCKQENMVIVVEFTDDVNDNCRRTQPLFVSLAREFESIPFMRVVVIPGSEDFFELRRDIGGVQYTPTFLILWFGKDKIRRAKYEGESEIKRGIGRMKELIKDFVERRVRMKMGEDMAEKLTRQVGMGRDEEKTQRGCEERTRHPIDESEWVNIQQPKESSAEEDEIERHREERRKIEQQRREARPQYVKELLQMDLDTAPIRDIKGIMIKLMIDSTGCINRGDLKRKLITSVPELRKKVEGESPPQTNKVGILTVADLPQLQNKLQSISVLWHPLGTKLGLDSQSLIRIGQDGGDFNTCLGMTLRAWLNTTHPLPTRATLAECLSSSEVGSRSLAESVLQVQDDHEDKIKAKNNSDNFKTEQAFFKNL